MSNHPIRELLDLRRCKGDVGIEIEVEALRRLPTMAEDSEWRSETDGSLRGYSMEYVLRKPCPIGKVEKYIDNLKELIALQGSKPQYSERAGVHVHVNVQEMTTNQVLTMAMVYYCMEASLVRYCGPDREGNHFCLRVQDADYVIDVIEQALRNRNLRYLDSEDIRYASLNFCALFRYGSLEFRAMETNPEFSKIAEWAKMLVAIRDYSLKLNSFEEIPFKISAQGPTGWAKEVLGDELFALINEPDFDQGVMRCMRPIQHLFYMKKD